MERRWTWKYKSQNGFVLGIKKTTLLKQGEIAAGKQKIDLPKSVVDLAVKQIKRVQRTKRQLQHVLAKIPEGDSRFSEREVVGFDHQQVSLLENEKAKAFISTQNPS
jgi:hypothetical protein